METLKFIKEELVDDDECHEDKSDDYCDTLDSCSDLKSEQLCDVEVENTGEFSKVEENIQNRWKTASFQSYYPKLSIPLVGLEYSRNKEIMKYLRPTSPAITSSNKLQFERIPTTMNLNLKTESVELETLTEDTLVQSSKDDRYASPWDFVSVPGTCDHQNNLAKDTMKTILENKNVSEKALKKEYGGETCSELSTCKPCLPRHASSIQNTSVSKKKLIQQTLNFEVTSQNYRKDREAHVGAPVELYDCGVSEYISRLQPRSSNSDSSPDRNYFCKSWEPYFMRNSYQIQHMPNKHSNDDSTLRKSQKKVEQAMKKFTCEICGKSVKQMAMLIRHRETHDITKWYECDICKNKFKMKQYLILHKRTHKREQYPCDYCQRIYKRKAALQRHVKLHSGEDTKQKFTLIIHKSQLGSEKHKNDQKTNVKTPLKLYSCDVCGKGFEDKSSMQIHIEFLHVEIFGEPTDRGQIPRPSNSSLDKSYRCRTCNKRYTQSSHLRRHETSHLPYKSQLCKLCGQQFSTTSSLSRHLLNKHDEIRSTRQNARTKLTKSVTNFVCKICNKAFKNLGDLRRHCAIHDARKPYECDMCKKKFAVKGYLYAHILTHDSWKSYPCQNCTKSYRRKSSLQRHMNISHSSKKKYECSICPKSFKAESTYRSHMERYHKTSTPAV